MNPYPGLRPFRTAEAGWFFGREALDGLLETRIHVSPLTLMFARSGVGKSSFLSCRFIPALAPHAATAYLNEWAAQAPEETLRMKADELSRTGTEFDEKPVLILDQFEDIFKLEISREAMWDALAEFVNIDDSPVNILISMREEWLGAWGEGSDYLSSAHVAMVRLAPLRDAEVKRAILKPAKREGNVEFSAELADQIVKDLKTPNAYGLGDRYVEPGLLQLVCRRLWDEASTQPRKIADVALYEKLGRADLIVRDFVGSHLRKAGMKGSAFSPFDRVLWAGMTRQLSAAHGVKSLVNPTMICKRMRTTDLGVAGPAILDYELTRSERGYLDKAPEKRAEPPKALITWVTRVLNAGESAGLLKKQRGLRSAESIYELSHDSLGPLLQQFALDLESWIRSRWYKLLGGLFGALVVLPMLIIASFTLGILRAIGLIAAGIAVLAVYVGFMWIITKLLTIVFEALMFPVLRRISKGVVPLSKSGSNTSLNRSDD